MVCLVIILLNFAFLTNHVCIRSRAVVEWCALYLLIGRGGAFQKDDIRAAFDVSRMITRIDWPCHLCFFKQGSLFFKLKETRRPTIKGAPTSSNTTRSAIHPTDFARMLPQSAVRTLEKQLNAALDTLPRSTLSMIESRFHSWVPGDDVMQQHSRMVEWGDDELGGSSSSNVSSPSLASTRRRSTLHEQHLTGTKYFSLDNQSFALTGVQGYHGTTSSYTSDESDSVSTPSTETSTLPTVMLSGLCPDGMDYYRDTPIKDWIGDNTLSGVARSAQEALPPTPSPNMMQPNRKVDLMADLHDNDDDSHLMEPTILSGVIAEKSDHGSSMGSLSIVMFPSETTSQSKYVLSPLSNFLRQHEEESTVTDRLMDTKFGLTGVKYDEAYINQSAMIEPVTLSGLLRHDTSDNTTSILSSTVEDNKQSAMILEPVTLSGLRADDDDTRTSFVEAPVDMDHPKTAVQMEPISLTGVRSSYDEGFSFFVQEPSTNFALEKREMMSLEPVKLTGLATNTIAKEFSPFVQEPEEDSVFDKEREMDIKPVTLSGLRQQVDSFTPFVQEPKDDIKNKSTKVAEDIEPVALSGLRVDDGSFASFVEEPTNNNVHKTNVVDMEPVQLSGLRSDDTFIQEPIKDDEESASSLQLKDDKPTAVALSGLREIVEFSSFVQERADYEPKAPAYDLAPVDMSCLRTGLGTEYLGFVDTPADYEPKTPVDLVPVTISCLRTGPVTEHAGFVDEPLDYQPKTPVTDLDQVHLSCLRDDETYASFVEAPLDLEKEPVDLDACAKPVPLSCLRADIGYASFVDENIANTIEKEPINLDECAKPVPMHCLRTDAGYAEFVNAAGYERDIEPVTLEVPEFQSLRTQDSEYLGFVKEPSDYKKAVHVPLEPPSTSFLQSDMEHLGFVKTPTIEPKHYDMESLGQQMDHLALSGLSKEENVEMTTSDMKIQSTGDAMRQILLSGLQQESVEEKMMETLPTVQLPWEESDMPMMKFVPEKISLTGMSQQQQINVPLKNWLNIGNLVGVTADKEVSLYEAPVDIPKEDVEQPVDLEQFRCAFPLPGVISDSQLTLKNWLNIGSLPGTVGSAVSLYESPASTMPEDYIQPSEDMDDGRSPMLGMINSDDKVLKNWLNTGALPGTLADDLLYEHPVDVKDEPPKLKKSELKQLRKPVPLPGIKNDDNVHLKNWLNTSALPGIRTTESSRFIYDNPGDDIPIDFIQVQEDMQQELTSLSGTIADVPKTPLKNWLSIDGLPGIQKDDTMIRLYEEAHELDPADYIEPTSSDMEGDVKLTGVLDHDNIISEEEDAAARRSSMEDTVKTDFQSEDEHSIATSETSHGPSPLLTSPKNKQHLSSEEWSAMAEIIEQKEE